VKELLFALIAVGLGTVLLFAGYRLARIILPLWGLFAGFTLGASAASDAFSNEFIGTTIGIIVGLIVGLVFALFAYFFYSLAVVLLGGTIGYWIGSGFITLLGFNKGFLAAALGIFVGVIFAVVALVMNAPKYFLIGASALGGAVAIIGGIMLLLNKIELSAFNYAAASTVISDSWLWLTVTAVVAVIGAVSQIKSNPDYEFAAWGTMAEPQQPKKVKAEVSDKEV
jgi:Domain of unknown function (DUF4203)